MDLSTLCNVLQGCLSPDLGTRKAAEEELSKVGNVHCARGNVLSCVVALQHVHVVSR